MQKTAIIVPCYNEAQRLRAEEFLESARLDKNLSFFFVNDGSTDETREILTALCRSNPIQMQSIDLETNVGKAEAVRRGVIAAGDMDVSNIGYWDADLATPLAVIPTFCELLDHPGITMVFGSRVRLLGRKVERRALRHYLGRIFATFASLILGLPVYDTQCGAKIFKNNRELKLVFGKSFSVKWIFDVEVVARFIMLEKIQGARPLRDSSVEYPLEVWTDVPGSKIKWTDFLVGAVELFRIFIFLRAPGAKQRALGFLRD